MNCYWFIVKNHLNLNYKQIDAASNIFVHSTTFTTLTNPFFISKLNILYLSPLCEPLRYRNYSKFSQFV